jgi:hypothetical protein
VENLHHHIIGSTGTGKSTLTKSLALEKLDFPVLFVDPLGHNALDFLAHLPSRVANRLCYIDLGDLKHPVGFNAIHEPQHLMPAIKGIYKDSWGPRLQIRLYHAAAAVYEAGGTFIDLDRMFTDEARRATILRRVRYKETRKFWLETYPSYSDRYNTEADDAVINKIGQFIASPYINAALSVRKPRLLLPLLLKHKYITVINANVPIVGEEHAYLYLSLFLSCFKTALTQNPTPCYAFLDEFQTYAGHHVPYFSSVLRNFGLSLTLSHQLLHQADLLTRSSILTNMAVKTVFRTSPEDAQILAPHFNRDGQENYAHDFVSLPDYHYWESNRGKIRKDFTQPVAPAKSDIKRLLCESRARFSKPL